MCSHVERMLGSVKVVLPVVDARYSRRTSQHIPLGEEFVIDLALAARGKMCDLSCQISTVKIGTLSV